MNLPPRPLNDPAPAAGAGGKSDLLASLAPGEAAAGEAAASADRAQVIGLARHLAARYGPQAGPVADPSGGPVRRALLQMVRLYGRTDDEGLRSALAADGNRLIGAARRVGFLRAGHGDFEALARGAGARPAAEPAPAAAGQTAAPSGYRVVDPVASRLEPFGGKATVFAGLRLRQGQGEPPADWKGLPKQPYAEFGLGVTSDAGPPFQPGSGAQTVKALAPRYQAYFDAGTPQDRLRAAVGVQAATADPDGRRSADLQLSGVHRWPDGGMTRGALQIGTPPPLPGAGPAVQVLLEHRQPLPGTAAALRLRGTLGRTGEPGQQNVGVAVGLGAPDRGSFAPASRPVLDLSASWQQASGRSSTTASARIGMATPDTVATVTLTHKVSRPDGARTTGVQVFAQQRLEGRVGDPNTSTATAGIDPRSLPTGRFPEGATRPITTLYVDGNLTLDRSTPVQAGPGPGPDTVRLGIVRNSPTGPVPTVYGEAYGDLTQYADGREPPHGRLGGAIGVHWRPLPDRPVTVHVELRAGAPGPQDAHGGTAAEIAVDAEISRDTFAGASYRHYFDGQGDEFFLGLKHRL